MSYRIEYNYAVFREDPHEVPGLTESCYVVAIEGGCNNTYESWPPNKRTRDWTVEMIGTKDEVLIQAVRAAAYCESGDLRPLNRRDATPESYIRRIRRLIETPPRHATTAQWMPSITLDEDHPVLALAATLPGARLGKSFIKWAGTAPRRTVTFDLTDRSVLSGYFRRVAPFLLTEKVRAWQLAEVSGLPES